MIKWEGAGGGVAGDQRRGKVEESEVMAWRQEGIRRMRRNR
jgi:hypothetical protein